MTAPVRNGREGPTTWREKVRVLGFLPKLLGLVWDTHRPFTATMVALRIVRGVVPIASLWVGKLIIDAVIHAAATGDAGRLWRYVAAECAIVLGGEVLARASALIGSPLGALV